MRLQSGTSKALRHLTRENLYYIFYRLCMFELRGNALVEQSPFLDLFVHEARLDLILALL